MERSQIQKLRHTIFKSTNSYVHDYISCQITTRETKGIKQAKNYEATTETTLYAQAEKTQVLTYLSKNNQS